jgi:hypothetical protein
VNECKPLGAGREAFFVADPGDNRFISAGMIGALAPGSRLLARVIQNQEYLNGVDFAQHCIANALTGRGLHSSTSQINLSRFWQQTHPKHSVIPPDTALTSPKQSLNAPPIPQRALTLSRKVDECKPLLTGPVMLTMHLEHDRSLLETVSVFDRDVVGLCRFSR